MRTKYFCVIQYTLLKNRVNTVNKRLTDGVRILTEFGSDLDFSPSVYLILQNPKYPHDLSPCYTIPEHKQKDRFRIKKSKVES